MSADIIASCIFCWQPSVSKDNGVCVKKGGSVRITKLINISLNDGIAVDDWKISRVTPVFKGGDKFAEGNYRPISVISKNCRKDSSTAVSPVSNGK